ncbi:hypothetical protein CHS0354_026025 [Potamilus streckersoni]|uniref:Apoptosis regulator Bcl-2 family BH4 domain-containing protein n=1 Tax=Potamilus streckersoni TaxID=2493646 RepID=A0AAE0VTL4_9BIVA|nr:hypothetical protein CHS0354_026025 [Potamilus streckersoni]
MSLNNNIEMNPSSSRYLVADFINHRLQNQGYTWPNCPPLGTGTILHITMRTIGDEFESRYREQFDDLVHQLNITPDIAYSTFVSVANELFVDGINWGRVVALFAFGGAIAVQCVEKNLVHLVDSIYEWLATYIDNTIQHWINSQGGWERFVEFYKSQDKKNESPWPSLGSICLGAVGVLALGAFLTQKS